jgi:hypothetical protein
MSLSIACPSCSAAMQVPEAAAGTRVTCFKCEAPFVVPETESVNDMSATRPALPDEFVPPIESPTP